VGAFAASVAADASADDLRSFVDQWRAGHDLLAEDLAEDAQFSLQRPVRTLHEALESLAKSACARHNGLSQLSNELQRRRGLMLVRLNRPEEAVQALRTALKGAPQETHFEIHQALSFAQQDTDPAAAIASMTDAIACAPTPDQARMLWYNRGALRSKQRIDSDAAIEDFSFVVQHAASALERHSALLGRARLRAQSGDSVGAIADFSLLLNDADATPRLAVSAWMDRGALLHAAGGHADAIADWGHAIHAADAEPVQRFRSLEARAQALEALGH
jgi:tetratricopeptide (TPR) repeat protein